MPRCFNFSLGRGLAELPLIRVALDLLALGSGRAKVEQSRLSALLLAGGWSAASGEADGRARLDAALRGDLPYFTTLPALIRLAERLAESEPPLCPQTVAALKGFVNAMARTPKALRPGEWADVFRKALKAAGWPGERELSSHEYQARRAFGEVLNGFGRFDALLGPLSLNEAVRRLSQLCRQRIFQPETRGRPAIQVLGVLESAGLGFDALWVMGMNDDLWPPPPRPNPLLPAELLRAAGAAHASAEVELDFAQRVHARLSQAAPEVTFSYAEADGNRVLRPSPLIAGIPLAEEVPGKVFTLAQRLGTEAGAACHLLDDALAPPVGEGEKVSGGSWLLRAQAICPAWAYYQFRLGCKALDEPVEGLDPAARGTLVHEALEAFWTAVRNSPALAAMSEAARRQAITEAATQALQHFELDRRITLPARFRELEAARLEKLLDIWLQVEGKRGLAFEVIACEQSAEVEIEEIKVKMVVNRIDQLADGRQVIIDYKTGAAIDIKNWADARITEPQLPIYAALVNDEVAAVVFAKVLLDKPAFAGVADEKDILPGVQGIGDDKQKVFDPAEFPGLDRRHHPLARAAACGGKRGQGRAGWCDVRRREVAAVLRSPAAIEIAGAAASAGGGAGWKNSVIPKVDHLEEDKLARQRALDVASFIVEAPAGAGKTELLTQRYLRLLAVVEHPEEVLALTFTNKAATEMRDRILGSLERAASGKMPSEPHKQLTFDLANKVLAHDAEANWGLLGHPGRLRITTLDALCASLARQMPYLSRFGAQPGVTEDAEAHYATAARRTLEMVESGSDDAEVVAEALAFMDNNAGRLETLLITMLGRRDQWLHHTSRIESGAMKAEVEAGFVALIERDLAVVAGLLDGRIQSLLMPLASFAAANVPGTLDSIFDWNSPFDRGDRRSGAMAGSRRPATDR